MTVRAKIGPLTRLPRPSPFSDVGDAYSQAGEDYLTYADGDPRRLFDFDGQYGYGDRQIWRMLESKLVQHRRSGAPYIRMLDAGCGPGTWLRRLVTRARQLGFEEITARGIDLARDQVERARYLARDLARLPGVDLRFEVADVTRERDETDGAFDLTLCLYCVLNHLPRERIPDTLAEVARLTDGPFVTSVRAAGSTPTIYVASLDHARSFQQDHRRDECDIELANGRRMILHSHLFTAKELHRLAAVHFEVESLRGLDLFHSRFACDPRWNPASLGGIAAVTSELEELEEVYASDVRFIDRATHLLLVGRSRRT